MITYVKDERYPLTADDIRRENPQVSFPADIPNWLAAEYGYQAVVQLPRPEVPVGQVADPWQAPQREILHVTTEEDATHPITNEIDHSLVGKNVYSNRLIMGWTLRPLTASEIAEARAEMAVESWRAKAILAQEGYLEAANTVVSQADPVTQMAWEKAPTFHRSSAAIQTIGKALGMDDATIDGLFQQAAAIKI